MFIMGTRCMAEVLFGVIGSTNVMFAFWQNNSAATHVCKNIPHCSWLRCVWQLWMDTDFGSFADKASLKQNTQANWHGHCTVAYMNTTHGDVTLNCSTKGRTEPGNGEIANTPTNQIWKCKTKNKIPSNPVNQFAGIVRAFCGYSAGILRVFCGYSAESTDYVFLAPFCFEFARVLREGMVDGGRAGMRSWGGAQHAKQGHCWKCLEAMG